jgi:hypothetical protein
VLQPLKVGLIDERKPLDIAQVEHTRQRANKNMQGSRISEDREDREHNGGRKKKPSSWQRFDEELYSMRAQLRSWILSLHVRTYEAFAFNKKRIVEAVLAVDVTGRYPCLEMVVPTWRPGSSFFSCSAQISKANFRGSTHKPTHKSSTASTQHPVFCCRSPLVL